MPTYLDKSTNTYYCKFYYEDYIGTRKQKLKRGFKLQREAKEWERNFLEQQQSNPDIKFSNLAEVYLEDMRHRLKFSTIHSKEHIINTKLIPFFGDLPISDITPAHVRKWQNLLIQHRDKNDKPYKDTYLKTMNNQLVAIMHYAVTYYNLPYNPCSKAGTIGKGKANSMKFWTIDEFNLFISQELSIDAYTVFTTLYFTGMRIGELQALTLNDIDLTQGIINVNHTLRRIGGVDYLTEPKTEKSRRTILIPKFLIEVLQNYIDMQYSLDQNDRIFTISPYYLNNEMTAACKVAKVPKIRLHDLRHSHASHLIELGYTPFLIAERLGHESVQTTMNTYGHLYPNKQEEVIDNLDNSIKLVSHRQKENS